MKVCGYQKEMCAGCVLCEMKVVELYVEAMQPAHGEADVPGTPLTQ
jgi:hypothetical protein